MENFLSGASNIVTIVSGSLALYIYFFKKDIITNFFSTMMTFALQTTLKELFDNLDNLKKTNAESTEGKRTALHILCDIEGQLSGNQVLSASMSSTIAKLKPFTNRKKELDEGRKLSLVSEIKENLRTLQVTEISKLGGKNEQ